MNMSYLVSYGSVYPQQGHHRGASIPADQNLSCTDRTWIESPDPNPNVAIGALVGGPDVDDTYRDVRENAVQGEPTTTSSAPFTCLLPRFTSNFTALRSCVAKCSDYFVPNFMNSV
jgi:endoglucanase